MTAARRWCLVAVGVLLLVSAPLAVNAWPASDPDIDAEALAAKASASADVGYSGYAEAVGGLALPCTPVGQSHRPVRQHAPTYAAA